MKTVDGSGDRSDGRLAMFGIGAFAVFLAVSAGLFWWAMVGESGGAAKYPLAWFVFPAAVLGATVNERSATIETPEPGQPARRLLSWWLGWYLWKITVAIVFAVLLWMLFVSTLVSGELFPAFTNTDQPFPGMDGFLAQIEPSTNADVAKLLVWSFVAGYSERFVPNLVEGLAGGAVHEPH